MKKWKVGEQISKRDQVVQWESEVGEGEGTKNKNLQPSLTLQERELWEDKKHSMFCFCDQLWGSNVSQSDWLDPYAFLGMDHLYEVYFVDTFLIYLIRKTLSCYKSIIQRAHYITW